MSRRAHWPGPRPCRLTAACAVLELQTSFAAPPSDATSVYDRRAQDWRNGAIVYQVIVDRFVPSADLQAKRALYPAPKVLHRDRPAGRGSYVAARN